MIYKDYTEIPDPALHDAVYVASHYCDILRTTINRKGECWLLLKGEVEESVIQRLMADFDGNYERCIESYIPLYLQDYEYVDGNTIFYPGEERIELC
jgi:translation initiation factor 2 beta subunit (eIF-2beta)/eIF-5